jgi:hypothetical protein
MERTREVGNGGFFVGVVMARFQNSGSQGQEGLFDMIAVFRPGYQHPEG